MKTRPNASAKPYYRCLSCMRFGVSCGGHSTRGMTLQEWCEYMRDVKDAKHLTNADISKTSGVSIKTIERIMAINYEQDIMRETARKIEIAVIGPAQQFPCYLDYDDSSLVEKINDLQERLKYWREENERKSKIIDKLV